MARHGLPALVALLGGMSAAAAGEGEAALTFEKDVRPIFRAHCFDCHGASPEVESGLDLRLVRLLTKGGDSGPAIVPGNPDASLFIQRIRAGEMPPGEVKVPAGELAVLEKWVEQGANTVRPEPESLPPGLGITPEERAFWSLRPVQPLPVPEFDRRERIRTPVDAFLLEKLRTEGLSFNPDADRATLIRRAYADLLGLPPSYEEVRRFVADGSPDTYERLVERLLADPRYGERWGRHWLDVAGYADSDGYADDPVRPYAYKYRDYVVRSLNADKPFDRFVVEQLAGDELVPAGEGDPTPERIEALAATGFLRMAADGTGQSTADPEAARNQVVADTIQIVSSSLLGLSVACARCHDHRYDPIPQVDYYRLRAVFEPALDWKAWRAPPERLVPLATAADRALAASLEAEAEAIAAERGKKEAEYLAAALEAELVKHPAELRDSLRIASQTAAGQRTPEQTKLLAERPSVNITPGVLYQYDPRAAEELKKFDARIAEVRAKKPVEDFVTVLTEPAGHAPATHVFHRGDHRQPLAAVGPGDLTISAPEGEATDVPPDNPALPTTGRRLAYARRLVSGRHPLVARVIANRVWLHHFGRGIVGTPADFGRLGERPTHPELLDRLADELVRGEWSVKQLHRTLMLSTAYRQSSQRDAARDAADSDGRRYSRMPVRRLEAEAVRDRTLAAAGVLDLRMYGPATAMKPDETGRVVADGADVRRSLYLQVRRTQPLPLLAAFDAPVTEVNCERRAVSTVATQSLMLMNGDFVLGQARAMAERARREAGAGATELVVAVWRIGYGRDPEPTELQLAGDFLAAAKAESAASADPELEALTRLCQAVMSSNEFLYVD
jgi:mono/diheme cytochrome c family protein